MDQRRIGMADIVIGEPLQWDAYDQGNQLLLRKGQIVANEHQVAELIARGLYVEAHHFYTSTSEPEDKRESPSVLQLINTANKRLEKLLYGLQTEADAQAKFLEIGSLLVEATNLDPDIALASILLNQKQGHYAARHGIDTAVLCLLVAKAMNKSDEETSLVVAAAFTMNLGMLRQHDQLEDKTDALSEMERALIQKHPQESVTLLQRAGIKDALWLAYVLMHHENPDGSGYPQGPGVAEIPQNARILTFADRYCACVSNRKYHKTLLPNAALRAVFLVDGKPSDPMLAAYFIREIGTYPPGSCVRLKNGEIGVVTRRGAAALPPTVHALIGPHGAPLSFPIQRDNTKDQFAIREPMLHDQATQRFSMQQMWGETARL